MHQFDAPIERCHLDLDHRRIVIGRSGQFDLITGGGYDHPSVGSGGRHHRGGRHLSDQLRD